MARQAGDGLVSCLKALSVPSAVPGCEPALVWCASRKPAPGALNPQRHTR